jgi:hypothetical protein
LFIAATRICPINPTIFKSRNIVSRARTSIAGEGSGTSVVCSLPRYRIMIANLAEVAARGAGCDTSLWSRTCVMPTENGLGIVLPLTWAVWHPKPLGKIIRRKLIPSREHVTWRDPTVTPTRVAISSRLIPSPTNFNLLDNLRGKFDASAPNGRAGIGYRHGCTVGRRGNLGNSRVLSFAVHYLCFPAMEFTQPPIKHRSTKARIKFLDIARGA